MEAGLHQTERTTMGICQSTPSIRKERMQETLEVCSASFSTDGGCGDTTYLYLLSHLPLILNAQCQIKGVYVRIYLYIKMR